jgi:radical SAM superfamily enzyme YgiQ (UPF0313 family)
MKVLVVNSPLFNDNKNLRNNNSLPPIGLGYVATQLQIHGIQVEFIDAIFENLSVLELINIVNEKKPNVIATNVFSTNYEIVKDFVEKINMNSIRFVIGGLSTYALYKNICNWNTSNHIDIVYGDGEYIISDIVTNTLKELPIFSNNNRRVFVVNNKSKYFVNDISTVPLNRLFFKNEPIKNIFGLNEANIVTSRGCIYNCAFCAASISFNKDMKVREKSKESIISEIEEIKKLYPIQSIRILDDLFLRSSYTIDSAIDIFNQTNLFWRATAHINTFSKIDYHKINKLKESGCRELFIGIESGSSKILKKIHKTDNVVTIKDTITQCLRVGIPIKAYFIYGFPEETERDFEKTYKLAYYLKELSLKYNTNFRTSVFQFRPYHETELYYEIIRKNSINIKPNNNLSTLIGRTEFNFYSENYSNEKTDVLNKYISATLNLNSFC